MFAEQGLSGARVDEIAERTRTTKRMIYYYFGGKEQLYRAVLEAAYLGIREAEQSIHATDLEPVEAVRRIAELTFDHHHAHPAFIRLVSIENIHRGEHLRQVESMRDLSRPVATLLDDALERGRASGEFRTDVDAIDLHMLISCVLRLPGRQQRDLRLPLRPRHERAEGARPAPPDPRRRRGRLAHPGLGPAVRRPRTRGAVPVASV